MSPDENKKSQKGTSSFGKRRKEGDDGKKTPRGGKEGWRALLVWFLISLVIIFTLQLIEKNGTFKEVKLSYSQFITLINDANVEITRADVVQKGGGRALLRGEVKDHTSFTRVLSMKNPQNIKNFSVNLPFLDSSMLAEWNKKGFAYNFEQEKTLLSDILVSVLPVVLLFGIFWFLMFRQMQAGQKGIFSFGKSRAKLHVLDRPKTTFADAAGVDEAKQELQEIIEFLKDPKKFKRLGGKIPKGVLLLGPPGTGKTLLARCVAGEAGVPFLSMSGSDFVEMFVGVGASRVRDLFDTAKKNAPSLIFIDEIDAVGRQRGAGLGGGHDEREQTLNAMLVEMDGFEENSGVILIAATNRPDVLDPALLRPGRFDRQVVVDMPDINGREGILKVHVKNIPLDASVDLMTLARATPGFVGADLANLVNEAALMAARFGQDKVTMLDFEEARDKVMVGAERKSRVLSEKDRKTTAYHEAGHAICHIYCPEADPLHKVTIIPRGRALGLTWSLPRDENYLATREKMLDEVCSMMGGRAAEQISLQQMTSGASNDIKQATQLVRRIICEYGMTEELGPVAYGEKQEQIFLGREFNQHRDYSEETAQKIDALVKRIVEEQMARAKKILTDHKDELDRLANALMEFELLDYEEVVKVIRGDMLQNPKKTRSLKSRTAPNNGQAAKVSSVEAGGGNGAEGNEKKGRNTENSASGPVPVNSEPKNSANPPTQEKS